CPVANALLTSASRLMIPSFRVDYNEALKGGDDLKRHDIAMAVLILGALSLRPVPAQTLKVMTFNVRLPTPNDGPNRWENRRDLLVKTIRDQSPDLIGTQELYREQGDYIVEKAPEFAWFGLSRRGNHSDEHMGVFYRKEKLRLADSGDFWLSETPDKPGSMSWGMSLPRMVTWGLFELRETGEKFLFWNTHFAHRSEDEAARLRAARLMASRLESTDPATPFLMTGDFNAPAGGDVYRALAPPLEDAWIRAARRLGPEGTFHGFTGKPDPPRIDWILYRGPWRVLAAETLTVNDGGRYPSDHFPVAAVLELSAR
ncbi:MAG: endonuclease/exonuclease/phosphatase family protein, partial [Bryobacteraceae bacterium]|nr:endonuclease/exonuclease/phosphatase family protein [Bryobacteraceae bacterium]